MAPGADLHLLCPVKNGVRPRFETLYALININATKYTNGQTHSEVLSKQFNRMYRTGRMERCINIEKGDGRDKAEINPVP